MFVHVDFWVIVQLFCLVQGATTAAYLLLAPRARGRGNRWLGLLVLALTLQVLDYFLSRSGVYYRHRWLYFTPLFFSWGFGPLLWAFVRVRLGLGPPRWLHFGPVAVQALFYLIISLQSFDTKTWFWLDVHKPITRYVEHYGTLVLGLGYGLAAARLLRVRGRWPRWAPGALAGLAAFWLAAALDPLLNSAYLPAGAPKFYLTGLGLPLLAYGLALAGGRASRRRGAQPAPAASLSLSSAPPDSAAAEEKEVGAGRAAAPVNAEQLARVVAALAEEELYKNPTLTLDGLAQHLGLSPNTVSQLLNAGLGQSFYELVNGYRLEEVKRRLLTADVQRLTVLALALEAGFNSKTTFNRVFKEKTGLTPKEYQKKYQATQRDDSVPAPG